MRSDDVSKDAEGSGCTWRRSVRSYGSGNCLEVAALVGQSIHIRDSRNPQGAVLQFTPAQWSTFLEGVRIAHMD